MEQQLERSLIANIGLSEKTHYEYIFVDTNNYIHISVPLSSGIEIAIDNTCKTATEIRAFAGLDGHQGILGSVEQYISDISKDINKLTEQDDFSQELIRILQNKQIRLIQLQNVQNLLRNLIPNLQQSATESGTYHLPHLIKEKVFKINRENCTSIILHPEHRDNVLNTSKLALFAMKRDGTTFYDSFGGKLAINISSILNQYKQPPQQENSKITTIQNVFDSIEQKLNNSTIDLSEGDAIFGQLIKLIQEVLISQGISEDEAKLLAENLLLVKYADYTEKPISAEFIIDTEMLTDEEQKVYPLKSLLNDYLLQKNEELTTKTVQPLQLLLSEAQTNHLESRFFNIKEPTYFSVAVQFFLGIANVHYYQKTGEHINFAERLEQRDGVNLIEKIKIAIRNNQPVEPVIFEFINETLLIDSFFKKRLKLDNTDQTTIIQKFNGLYNLVKDSPHMDEFFLLVEREGHYVSHQGRMCIQLSEYCKQVNSSLYQQFFGGSDPKLASQPLANSNGFILPPSNKETIEIGSIPIDFTNIHSYTTDDLVKILLTEDTQNSGKRFFHNTSDTIKAKFKSRADWVRIQDRVIRSLQQSQMTEFGVEWKLFTPLHLTPLMTHGLIAEYGMNNDLANLNGKPLKEKIPVIFNKIGNLKQPNHVIPHEDGGLILLFNNDLNASYEIEKIQLICQERQNVMHIYPNMAKSLYQTVTSISPEALSGSNNNAGICEANSTITITFKKLLPDLEVYSAQEIINASEDKKEKIDTEIKNGTAVSIKFYKWSGHLFKGTSENLERIRAIHYIKTRVTLSETQIYQLMFSLAKQTPQEDLTVQQIQAIRNGELLPNVLTLMDVKDVLDQFKLEYAQLQTDGVFYSISMEDAAPLKELLCDNNNQDIPSALQQKLIDRRLKVAEKKLADISSAMTNIHSIEISDIKSIETYINELNEASVNESIDLAYLIDHHAKKLIANLEDTVEPELSTFYTELIKKQRKQAQDNQIQLIQLKELTNHYESTITAQANTLTEFKEETHQELNEIINHIHTYVDKYNVEEELQYKQYIYALAWDQKDFLNVITLDKILSLGTSGFNQYKNLKIILQNVADFKRVFQDYSNQYQNWKKSELNKIQKKLSALNFFGRLYYKWSGQYKDEIKRIEDKVIELDREFQNTKDQINLALVNWIESPDGIITNETINLQEHYQNFKVVLEKNSHIFTDIPDQLSFKDTIEEGANVLNESCAALQTLINQEIPIQLPEPPSKVLFLSAYSFSLLCMDAQLEIPQEFTKENIRQVLEKLKITGIDTIYTSSTGVMLLGHFEEETRKKIEIFSLERIDNKASPSRSNLLNNQISKDHLKEMYDLISKRGEHLSLIAKYVDQAYECKDSLPQTGDGDEVTKNLELNIEMAEQNITEVEQINTRLMTLIKTFNLDPKQTAYESLSLQVQLFEDNLIETQAYCDTVQTSFEEKQANFTSIQSESTIKLEKLKQDIQIFEEEFPLIQDIATSQQRITFPSIEDTSQSKVKAWVNMQKIYDQAKNQIEKQTTEYVNYVNHYLNDNKINGFSRWWRAHFGTHTHRGIKLAQENLKKVQAEIDQQFNDFDTKLRNADAQEDFDKLMSEARRQLSEFLLENLKSVHEKGSGFNPHSYTTHMIYVNQDFQDILKGNKEEKDIIIEENDSPLELLTGKQPEEVEKSFKLFNQPTLTSEIVKKTYTDIIKNFPEL